ncbi:MAG: YncE family protein, partial [Solirubrobacteraceae bacterium]
MSSGASGPFAYVPGIVGGNVAIFNASTYTLVSAITTSSPTEESLTNVYGVAATPDGTEVWVTDSGTNAVSVITTATNTITGTVIVGVYPHGIAITPDGTTAYVANTGPNTGPGGSQTISVVDVASQTVTGTITVGEAPEVVTVSPDGSLVLVTCADGVYVIATSNATVRKVRERLRNPHGVTVTPDGTQAYVTDSERDQVIVLDTSSMGTIGRVSVGSTPWNTAFTADGSSAYVTNANDDTVSVIDTASKSVTTTIALGAGNHIPTAIVLSPEGNIWVTCNASSSLVVIDTSSNAIQSIEIGLGDSPTG